MKQPTIPWGLYVITAGIFLASFALSAFLPTTETIRLLVATPGIGALFVALLQLLRDRWAHDRAVELKEKEQDFALGTASHMAQVAYDKHAAFCEEYMSQLQNSLRDLIREGPHAKTQQMAFELGQIRVKYAAWLTDDIESELRPFEIALSNINIKNFMLQHEDRTDQRQKLVEEMYDLYLAIIDAKKIDGDESAPEISQEKVIERIRGILGIKDLVALRTKAMAVASSRLSSS